VSKPPYPYPEDEFDVVGRESGPRGVHRAPRSAWATAAPFVLVVLLFSGLAYGLVTYLYSWQGLTLPGQEIPDDLQGQSPSASASATTPAATPTTTPPPPVAPKPLFGTPVTVYNATSIRGLAADGAAALTTAGFTKVTAENFTGRKPAASTVFYASDDLKVTAEAAAASLGITTVTLSPAESADGIAVVLVSDFRP
jgi:hypothetical protein